MPRKAKNDKISTESMFASIDKTASNEEKTGSTKPQKTAVYIYLTEEQNKFVRVMAGWHGLSITAYLQEMIERERRKPESLEAMKKLDELNFKGRA